MLNCLRTGITPERIADAFHRLEKLESELEAWTNFQQRQREEAERQLQALQRFMLLTNATTVGSPNHLNLPHVQGSSLPFGQLSATTLSQVGSESP